MQPADATRTHVRLMRHPPPQIENDFEVIWGGGLALDAAALRGTAPAPRSLPDRGHCVVERRGRFLRPLQFPNPRRLG